MPLQPELLQAILWQGIRIRLDLPEAGVVSPAPPLQLYLWSHPTTSDDLK